MGSCEAAVPVARGRVVSTILALWALALPTGASAQYPTDLYKCLTSPGVWPACEVTGDLVIGVCSLDPPTFRYFDRWLGRLAFFPLRCVGPITVSVETTSPVNTRFPLYVEIVPLQGTGDYHVCEDLPGYVVLIVYGHFGQQCGTWNDVGPVDITTVVPLGSLYALRLHAFARRGGYSPAVDCIRVTAHPVETPVAPTTWGRVKALFR